jgi:hypothetical protein
MLAGCVMDLVSVRQQPTTLEPAGDPGAPVVLQGDVSVALGTGFPTKLRQGTTWRSVGKIAEGEVFATRDQTVTVEASNIHEAHPVIAGGKIVGFYLPVEHTFARAAAPVAIVFQPAK